MENPAPSPRPSRITIPSHCHPAAKIVFAEMARQRVNYDELEHRSGVLKSSLKAWRTKNSPGLDTLAAALGALGWEFLPVPPPDALHPEVRERLVALADEFGLDEDAVLTQYVREVAQRPLNTVGVSRGRPSPFKKPANDGAQPAEAAA